MISKYEKNLNVLTERFLGMATGFIYFLEMGGKMPEVDENKEI